MTDIKEYETALVLGLGVSGRAAAELLLGEGVAVTVVDSASNSAVLRRAESLRRAGAEVETGQDSLHLGRFDICVVSPGIPSDSRWVQEVESHGIRTICELELGAMHCRCPMLAVTGTNGKSTMVKLCAETLQLCGIKTAAAGNYGVPVCALAGNRDLEWLVVEVSSFQLERVKSFRPRVGVLLNIGHDHLDRHGDMDTYLSLKRRMFEFMGPGDIGIVLDRDRSMIADESGPEQWFTFGLSELADYRYGNGLVTLSGGVRELRRSRRGGTVIESVSLRKTWFDNDVLGSIGAAAVAAIDACGADPAGVERAAAQFVPLPHRMTRVAGVNGIEFVDDSKATNLAALEASLSLQNDNAVRLIAGGLLKEKKLNGAKELLARKAKCVYLIGDGATAMEASWRGSVPCRRCGDMNRAVRAAWADAAPGETILLAPGCASFDQFEDFEERGRAFAGIVDEIRETARTGTKEE